MILHCTKKLIKTYDLTIIENQSSNGKLEDWYANLIYIDGKKCLLLVESESLYSLLLPNFKKSDMENIESIFKNHLIKALSRINIGQDRIEEIFERSGKIQYTTTQSRSILGSMNEYAFQYKALIIDRGGLEKCDVDNVIYNVNNLIMGAIDYNSGSEEIQKILEE